MEIIKSTVPVRKKKRVSKKSKSSWRKHSCVEEVEQYFEAKRQQERVGTITAENVAGLFEDDKKLLVNLVRTSKIDLLDSKKAPLSSSRDQRLKVSKIDYSKVPTLTRRDLRKPKYKGGDGGNDDDGVKDEEEDDRTMKEVKNPYGIWDSKDGVVDELELYRRRICRTHPVKRPPSQRSCTVPAIVTPHPGQSYNPSFQDHQSLLQAAVSMEAVKLKRDKKVFNATDAMFPSKNEAPTRESWLAEMSQGLGGMVKLIEENKDLKGASRKMVKRSKKMNADNDDDQDGDADDDNDEEDDYVGRADETKREKKNDDNKKVNFEQHDDDDDDAKNDKEEDGDDDDASTVLQMSYNAPVRREDKKSQRMRKKMMERRKEELKRQRDKRSRTELSQTFRVKSLRKEVLRQEMARAARLQRRVLQREASADAPKKLGKSRFEEPAPDLKLTDEIRGDLRSLKPEGHLMKELVHSLQRRNITPTTPRGTAIKQRKYKPKVFEKKSHKAVKRD